jgi:hypothetical protein
MSNVEKLARYVDKEEKIGVKLIVSAHVLERISHVASTGFIDIVGLLLCILECNSPVFYQRIRAFGFRHQCEDEPLFP